MRSGTRHWRSWLAWLPLLVKPLRRGALILVLLLVVEYLVVPELVGASKDLYLLGQVNAAWVAAGVALEGVSLFCYAVLTRVLLPPGPKPGLSVLFRIDLSAAAVAHVIPAGTLGTAALGYRLFTAEGVSGNDAAVMMAAKGLGSTVVLNVLLWLSLVVSIPLAGFRPVYGTVAVIGTVVLLGTAALVLGVIRGTGLASRVLRAVGGKIPGLSGDAIERVILEAGAAASTLVRDKSLLAWSLLWASLNWLLDAASLWCFVAAFGHLVNPVELFAAYGIANVAGALPVTPGGLGVVDSVAPLLLVSFGVTRSVATLGVIGWRLVNFWLPIPAGAIAFVTLKVKPRGGARGMWSAISGMFTATVDEPRYNQTVSGSPASADDPAHLIVSFASTLDGGADLIGTSDQAASWLRAAGLLPADAVVNGPDHRALLRLRDAIRDVMAARASGADETEALAGLTKGLADGRVVVTAGPAGTVGLASAARASYSTAVAAFAIAIADCSAAGTWVRLKACIECGRPFRDDSPSASAARCPQHRG
jgi:uncharacterized protein (TIRG00374 family)